MQTFAGVLLLSVSNFPLECVEEWQFRRIRQVHDRIQPQAYQHQAGECVPEQLKIVAYPVHHILNTSTAPKSTLVVESAPG